MFGLFRHRLMILPGICRIWERGERKLEKKKIRFIPTKSQQCKPQHQQSGSPDQKFAVRNRKIVSRILCVFISISSFLPLFLSNLPANLADKTDYTPILLCKQDIFCLFPCQLLYFHVEYSFRTLLKFTIQEEFL